MATAQAHQRQHRYHFCGAVQGVGFRFTAQNLALGYNVGGYVRNLSDGSVEMVVEGPPEEMDRLVADLRRKMNGFIRKVESQVEPATGEFHGFGIRHWPVARSLMYRTLVIISHTFLEAIVQPIYALLITLGAAVVLIFNFLPFFTLGEDTKMFISVGLDVILLLVLITTLFATSRSIYEEIEDRTMLTLMSKPVSKWEVLAGKYLGIVLSALLGVVIVGVILCLCVWWRVPNDYSLRTDSLDDRVLAELAGYRHMHLAGVMPSLVQVWLQICTLAAVGVALSTRFSLVVNLPTVIIIYFAGNLTRFILPVFSGDSALAGRSWVIKVIAYVAGLILPTLELFDLRPLTVYSKIAVRQFTSDPNAVSLGTVWVYLAMSAAYAVAYVCLALSAGMWLFRRRELGGSEG